MARRTCWMARSRVSPAGAMVGPARQPLRNEATHPPVRSPEDPRRRRAAVLPPRDADLRGTGGLVAATPSSPSTTDDPPSAAPASTTRSTSTSRSPSRRLRGQGVPAGRRRRTGDGGAGGRSACRARGPGPDHAGARQRHPGPGGAVPAACAKVSSNGSASRPSEAEPGWPVRTGRTGHRVRRAAGSARGALLVDVLLRVRDVAVAGPGVHHVLPGAPDGEVRVSGVAGVGLAHDDRVVGAPHLPLALDVVVD